MACIGFILLTLVCATALLFNVVESFDAPFSDNWDDYDSKDHYDDTADYGDFWSRHTAEFCNDPQVRDDVMAFGLQPTVPYPWNESYAIVLCRKYMLATATTTSSTPTDSVSLTTLCSPGECECFASFSHENLTKLPDHLERFTEISLENKNNIKNIRLSKSCTPHRANAFDLSFNHVTDIPATTFANFRNLHYLKLSHNNISGIASGAFQHLEDLVFLGLNDNKISHISSKMFTASDSQTRPWLGTLHLSNNRLETLPRELLRTFPDLQTISLAGNPWRCDRKLLFLRDAMAETPSVFADRDEVRCATPLELSGMKVADLDTDLLSRLTTEFPSTVRVKEIKEGRFNTKTVIIIGVSASVLGLALTVVIVDVVVRNVRRWKRVYRLDTHDNNNSRVLEASVGYRHLNNTSSCGSTPDTEARITILMGGAVGAGDDKSPTSKPEVGGSIPAPRATDVGFQV